MSYGYTENGKFRHSYAGLPKLPTDGYYRYRTNPNPDTVPWIITGAMRVTRILTDAETDAICREAGVEPMKRQGGPLDAEKLAALGLKAGDGARLSVKGANPYEGKSLAADSTVYGYDFLTALPDMQVTVLPEVSAVRNAEGKVDTGKAVTAGMRNARNAGAELDGKVFVRNGYTGRQLRIDTASIRHGLNGGMNRLLTNARLGAVIGDVVKNAVPINALQNKAKGVTGTYAMAAYATDSRGREFVAIVTVEQYDGNISGVEVYDVTHAVSGRQKNASRADTKSQGVYPSTTGTISIEDFLEIVNTTHQSAVVHSYGHQAQKWKNPIGQIQGHRTGTFFLS